MKPLEWDVVQMIKRNRDGAHVTQQQRAKHLKLFARDMQRLGLRNKRVWNLKQRDFVRVIRLWQHGNGTDRKPVSGATLQNRVAALRWLAEKLGKRELLPPANRTLGIDPRTGTQGVSKARALTDDLLRPIRSENVRHSLKLQAAFGLRREEAMKIQPRWADRGDKLVLKGSWTKGGRERAIPIRTQAQRRVLDAAKAFAGNGSLIPPSKSYREHVNTWERQTKQAGLSKTHGLRHAYAQQRYEELTGRRPPVRGGVSAKDLGGELKDQDHAARLQIAQELGHSRSDIVNIYVGR